MESLLSAAAEHGLMLSLFITGEATLTGEASSNIAGRSCLPHIKFPPSLTLPLSFGAGKVQFPVSLADGFRGRRARPRMVAPLSTRDSILTAERKRGKERGESDRAFFA